MTAITGSVTQVVFFVLRLAAGTMIANLG